jgi:hypothetical protein
MRKEYNTSVLTQFNVPPKPHDSDLIMPWDEAEAGAQELLSHPEQQALNVGHAQQDVLDVIKLHVIAHLQVHAHASSHCWHTMPCHR